MPRRGYDDRLRCIEDFLNNFDGAPAVVTCRIQDYQSSAETLNMVQANLAPLNVEQQLLFLKHYLGPAKGGPPFWELAGGDTVSQSVGDVATAGDRA